MSDGVERLARAYMERQGLDEERARALAREVTRDPEVMSSALRWVDKGEFDDLPAREGYSPKTLSALMSPTGVFSTLVRLRTRKEQMLTFLRQDRASIIARRE
jgi:hypothetical protein